MFGYDPLVQRPRAEYLTNIERRLETMLKEMDFLWSPCYPFFIK